MLSIDGKESATGNSMGKSLELNLRMKLYVGSVKGEINRQSGVVSGFNGAIQRVSC